MIFHTANIETEADMHCFGKEKYTTEDKIKTFIFQIQGWSLEFHSSHKNKPFENDSIHHWFSLEIRYQGAKTIKLC